MNMKVLMYGWEFPPLISGGLGIACYAIVKELAKKEVDINLVLPQTVDADHINRINFISSNSDSFLAPRFEGVVSIKRPEVATYLYPYASVKDFQYDLSNEAVWEFLSLLNKLDLPLDLVEMTKNTISIHDNKYEINLLTEVFKYALYAGALAQDVEHDVIHAHDWLTILAALKAKRRSKKPLVFHIHALETDRSGIWVDKRIFAIEKYGMEQADQVIAVSQYTKDNIVEHYGIAPEKISVVHNGIYRSEKPSQVIKENRPPMVLFLGRITHQKGPYFFIEIAKRVLEKRSNVHFVLAGTGDLLVDMIEHVAGLRIGKNVHFIGFLDRDQVCDIYELADVYVMPSVSEPFGLSALEACSHDVPAVISKQSGAAEVLANAILVDFWDIEEMATQILALLESPALGKASLADVQDNLSFLTWDRAAEKIIDLYKKVTWG